MLKVLKMSIEELEAMVEFENPVTGNLQFNPTEQALALWAIRARGLWKDGKTSFEDYMKDVWHCSLKTGLRIVGLVDDSVGQYGPPSLNAEKLINWGRVERERNSRNV